MPKFLPHAMLWGLVVLLAGCSSLPPKAGLYAQLPYGAQAQLAFMSGQLAEDQGDFHSAAKFYREALLRDPSSVTLRRYLAGALIRLGLQDEAIAEFRTVLKEAPSDPKAYYLMGQLYEAAGDTATATAVYHQALERDLGTSEIHGALGLLLLHEGRRTQGVAELKRALALDPANSEARRSLVGYYLEHRRVEAAKRLLRQAAEAQPERVEWLLDLAAILNQQDRRQEAFALYQQVLLINPLEVDAHHRVAEYYLDARRWRDAVGELEWLQKFEPENTLLQRNLGLAFYELGLLDKAREQLHPLIQSDRADALTHFLMGGIYQQKQFWHLAVQEYQQALLQKPDFVEAQLELAGVLLQIGEKGKAEAEAEKIGSRIRRNSPLQLSRYGWLLLRLKRSVRALEVLTEAARLDPRNAQTRFFLGQAYYDVGQFEHALAAWEKAVKLDPTLAEAYNHLGYTCAEKGVRLKQAEFWMQQALRLEPKNGNFHDSMGWVYYRQREYKKALAEVLLSLEMLKQARAEIDPEIYSHLAQIYQKLGRWSDAESTWSRLLQADPGNAELQHKLEELRGRMKSDQP